MQAMKQETVQLLRERSSLYIAKPWKIYNSDGERFMIFYITLTIGGALSSSTTYMVTERY